MRWIARVLAVLLSLGALILGCRPFNNPVDSGNCAQPSVDADGDGIGSWWDVDDIYLVSPMNGATVQTLPLTLEVYRFDPARVRRYCVQLSRSADDFEARIAYQNPDLDTNECVVSVQGLQSGETYYWRAKAYDGSKWSDDWSAIWSLVLDIAGSGATHPSPEDGSTTGDTTPTLNWEDVTGATGYHLQLNSTNDFSGDLVGEDSGLAISEYAVSTPLANDATYYWRVKVQDANGLWGDWSTTWQFTVDLSAEVPVNPSPTNGETIMDTTPLLDWEDVAAASGYHVQLSTVDDFATTVLDDTTSVTSAYQVSMVLSDNASYFWRVKIRNADGVWGDWSATWSFAVDIPAPTTLSPGTGSTTADTTPLLDWDDVDVVSGYQVQLSTLDDFAITTLDDPTLTTSEYQVSTVLSDNASYYWRVRIKNQDGVPGDWSATLTFTVEIPPPVTPSPQNGASIADTTPLLDWGDAGAAGYRVQLSTISTFSTTLVDDATLTASQYQVTAVLADNATHYWRVSAKNADGVWGDWSSGWQFTVVDYYSRTYGGGVGSGGARRIVGTPEGGWVLAGVTTSWGAGGEDFWVVRLDTQGDVVWQKAYGGATSDHLLDLATTADGGFIAVGWTVSFGAGDADAWVVRLDSNGSVVWQKAYGSTSYDDFRVVDQTLDGGFLAAGRTPFSGDQDVWVVKLNGDGTIAWQISYEGAGSDRADDVVITSDGGFTVFPASSDF